ncbi:MAG: ArgE/DapE family deacylase [Candidatus Omnitrophica bacterium]|nr:ArgE/DapE family deacylase [Candidatus Omnitrophota bacterium]
MIRKDRLVKLTQKLVRFDSSNPPGLELDCARFIEKDMRSLGLEVKTVSYAKNRPNVIATLKGTAPRAKAQREALLLTPHFDTVPVGEGWKFKPFGGEIRAGKIYGRGTSDDKGNTAACMEVMRSLVEDGIRLEHDVVMAATVDEECGSHLGIIPLIEKKVVRPKLALVVDSTEFDAVITQKGVLFLRARIFGKKAHSAFNWRGDSAIETAARCITRLTNIRFPYKRHRLLHAPTINMGVIHGGDKVNMVADVCEFTIDHRFCPGTPYREPLGLIREAIAKEARKFKLIVDDIQQPYEIAGDHPYVRKFMQVNRALKSPAKLKGSEGATVITFFQKHGIPAFATGWGAHGTLHTNDEYIYIKSLYHGTRILERFVREFDALA